MGQKSWKFCHKKIRDNFRHKSHYQLDIDKVFHYTYEGGRPIQIHALGDI